MTSTDDKPRQLDLNKSSMASKKMRMTLACVRCRSKKVKCDTQHPSCTRCFQAKVSCSYEGSSSQIDIYNLIKLNDTVGILQKRIQDIESTIGDIQHTKSTVCDDSIIAGPSSMVSPIYPDMITPITSSGSKSAATLLSSQGQQPRPHPHQWSLSLTSTGLRIDTNIVSLPNLYNILLSGISQLDLNQHEPISDSISTSLINNTPTASLSSSSISSSSSSAASLLNYSKITHRQQQQHQQNEQESEVETNDMPLMVQPKTPLWRSKMTTFPLYSTWSSEGLPRHHQHQHPSCSDRHHLHNSCLETTVTSALDTMIDIYSECFLCLPDTGYGGTISERYQQGVLDPLLANAIFAWSARHGAIYHNLYKGQDPNQVGECYFHVAKDLLKDRFTIPSIDTLHGVLILYIYAIGRPPPSQQQQQQQTTTASEAYIFLGLAIRMCLDMKLHKEKMDGDDDDDDGLTQDNNNNNQRMKMERDRRFFWVLYFLETLCTLHSDRPFSLPSEDEITVTYPDVLGNETGERRWRTEFMMKRFRITHIYRDIIQRTSQSTLMPLSCISELDANLCEWYDNLPPYMQYQQGDWQQQRKWKSTSFREQACIKLNFEYHFQRCQLYAVFLKRKPGDKDDDDDGAHFYDQLGDDNNQDGDGGDEEDHGSTAMETKAKNVCATSAMMTVELMQCWNQLQQRWCHFSLEALMMCVNIFEMLLKDNDQVEQIRTHLNTILDILQASPIQHHRHVIIVTTRIQKLLKYGSDDGCVIGWVPRVDEDMGITTTSTAEATTTGSNDRNNDLQTTHHHPLAPTTTLQHSMDMYNSFMTTQHANGMMGTHYGDLPFSDFLYNPVMQLPSSSFGAYTTTAQQQWTDVSQSTQLPLAPMYSSTPPTAIISLSSTYSTPPVPPPPPSDNYSTRSSAVSGATSSLWTTTTTTLHQPTYASNGSAIYESISLQPDPTNGHPPSHHNSHYSTDQR